MIVTLTSKGQLTLPKPIRDQMGLDAGSKLDFIVQADGTLKVRPLRSVSTLAGMLRKSGRKPVSVEDMDHGIGEHLDAKYRRVLRERPTRQRHDTRSIVSSGQASRAAPPYLQS